MRLPGLDENIHSLSQQTFLEHQSGPPVPLPGAGLTRQVRPYSEKLTVSRCLFIRGHRGGWVLSFPSSELPLRTKLPRILQVNFRWRKAPGCICTCTRCSARVWIATCMHAKLLRSCPTLCNPRDYSRQAPLPMGFSRQQYWSGLPCPPPVGLSDPGIEPESLMSPALAGGFFITSPTWQALELNYTDSQMWSCSQHVSPGNLIDIQTLRLHPRPPESENLGQLWYNRPSRGFWYNWNIRATINE